MSTEAESDLADYTPPASFFISTTYDPGGGMSAIESRAI